MLEPNNTRADGAATAPDMTPSTTTDWRRYARVLFVTLALELLTACALITAANPYGNLPVSLVGRHEIMDTNQRYQYPAIARSGLYDSIVIGTSTSRLLRPAAFQSAFGGHFANLAMDDSAAWEQYRMASLFAHEVGKPRTLVVGLDHVWCRADADQHRMTERGFPEWMFDDNPWNDVPWMLNARSVEFSLRRIAHAVGLKDVRIPFDGYEVFVPPEAQYDLTKAKANLKHPKAATTASAAPSPEDLAAFNFPALAWLDELLGQSWERVILLITPVHIGAQPVPGQTAAWRETECKARMAAIAQRHGVPLADFRIKSEITSHDENYWDPLHYRIGIAERIVSGLDRAVKTKADDPAGDWHVLSAGK